MSGNKLFVIVIVIVITKNVSDSTRNLCELKTMGYIVSS